MKKALALSLCLFALTACDGGAKAPVEYVPYAEISETYSLSDAKGDRCVVFENLNITSGQSVWDDFLAKTQDGEPCMVRLAFYYTLGDPSGYAPELYEEIKGDYPVIYVQDLRFDGNRYTLFYTEGDREYSFEYSYLKRFEGQPRSETAIYSDYVKYALVNDDTVTWEQIEDGLASSQAHAGIDHQTVYSKYAYKGE